MNKPNFKIQSNFTKVYQQFTLSGLSIQATYLYGKIIMLLKSNAEKTYSESTLGRNRFSGVQEISREQVSHYVNELIKSGFLDVEKQRVPDKDFFRNCYKEVPIAGYWGAISNDFINLTTLTAKEKGFAMQLASFPEYMIPKSINGIGKLLHLDNRSVAKYLKALIEVGAIFKDYTLNPEYFLPLYKFNTKEEIAYNKKLKELELLTGNIRIQKQLEWLKTNLTPDKFSYKFLCEKLNEIEWGVFSKIESEKLCEPKTITI